MAYALEFAKDYLAANPSRDVASDNTSNIWAEVTVRQYQDWLIDCPTAVTRESWKWILPSDKGQIKWPGTRKSQEIQHVQGNCPDVVSWSITRLEYSNVFIICKHMFEVAAVNLVGSSNLNYTSDKMKNLASVTVKIVINTDSEYIAINFSMSQCLHRTLGWFCLRGPLASLQSLCDWWQKSGYTSTNRMPLD